MQLINGQWWYINNCIYKHTHTLYKSETTAPPIKKQYLFFYPLKLGVALGLALGNGRVANVM